MPRLNGSRKTATPARFAVLCGAVGRTVIYNDDVELRSLGPQGADHVGDRGRLVVGGYDREKSPVLEQRQLAFIIAFAAEAVAQRHVPQAGEISCFRPA